jgi:hypothetical protein
MPLMDLQVLLKIHGLSQMQVMGRICCNICTRDDEVSLNMCVAQLKRCHSATVIGVLDTYGDDGATEGLLGC